MGPGINIDGEYWRRRAEEARTLAGEMTGQLNQDAMLKLAERYDRLADEADRRGAGARR